MKLFVYPQHKEKQILNPYTNNMERALGLRFEIVHKEYRHHLPQALRFLLGSTKADVYVLNWIESAADELGLSLLFGCMTMLTLRIILLRKAKIVWVFHNIHPHKGETKWSRRIKNTLFKQATFIVSHSKEAAEYAKQYAACPVFYKDHPIKITEYEDWNGRLRSCDFYIWGNIYPYKGVLEFISNPHCASSMRDILIVGKCDDEELRKKIEEFSGQNVIFENRRASFAEVAAQCKKAKYVLFPYVGESVSSSGALIDTLQMGGIPVGPNRGAFDDLGKKGCCITYNNIDEVYNLPVDESKNIKLKDEDINDFLKENTWESFANWLYDIVV